MCFFAIQFIVVVVCKNPQNVLSYFGVLNLFFLRPNYRDFFSRMIESLKTTLGCLGIEKTSEELTALTSSDIPSVDFMRLAKQLTGKFSEHFCNVLEI